MAGSEDSNRRQVEAPFAAAKNQGLIQGPSIQVAALKRQFGTRELGPCAVVPGKEAPTAEHGYEVAHGKPNDRGRNKPVDQMGRDDFKGHGESLSA